MSTYVKGIDVSEWQGDIDWASAKELGVQFAVIRMGLGEYVKNGTTYAKRADKYFAKNVAACEKYDIPYGVYYFSYAVSLDEVKAECEHAKSLIDETCNKKPFIVAYDFEGDTIVKAQNRGYTLGKYHFNQFMRQWNNFFGELGYQTPIYMNQSYVKNMYDKTVIGDQPIWLAKYATGEPKNVLVDGYSMWQYTNSFCMNGKYFDGDYTTEEYILSGIAIDIGGETMTNANAISYTKLLLGHYPFVYCPTLASKTTNKTPNKGDIVLFYNSGTFTHTGLVYAVDGTKFYTIEGNTSGASGIVANGGGVCKKSYKKASYTSSKFFRPNYAKLVEDGYFKSTDAVIQKVIDIASAEVGYLEKKSNANLDSKTANAGSNNYTKYWRDIKSDYQAQPWCACFVTWCLVKAFESAGGTTTATTKANNPASGMQTYKNGSTEETVYKTSACKEGEEIGSLDANEQCYCFGYAGGAYLVCYKVNGTTNTWKAGYVKYSGGTTF